MTVGHNARGIAHFPNPGSTQRYASDFGLADEFKCVVVNKVNAVGKRAGFGVAKTSVVIETHKAAVCVIKIVNRVPIFCSDFTQYSSQTVRVVNDTERV
jgi:hypothetical protein